MATTYHTRSEINDILKKHGYGTIESDKTGASYGTNLPYRTQDGKILKGISLFRTSPVTMTNIGIESGKAKVNSLFTELCAWGTSTVKGDFVFKVEIKTSEKKTLTVLATDDSREGLVYDQTFHFLCVSIN